MTVSLLAEADAPERESVLPSRERSTKWHAAALDGVRGFAALVVLLSHCSFLGLLPGTSHVLGGIGRFGGVYVFFVLSAFLLSARLQRVFSSVHPWFGLADYFYRRAIRILPLYLVVISAYWAVSSLTGREVIITSFERWLRSAMLFRGYGIFWTIPVEFLFYCWFPVFVVLLRPVMSRLTRALLATFASVGFLLVFSPSISDYASFTGIFTSGFAAYEWHCVLAAMPQRASRTIRLVVGSPGTELEFAL